MEADTYKLAALIAIANRLTSGAERSIAEMRALVEAHYDLDLDKDLRATRSVWNHIIQACIKHKVLVKTRKKKKELRAGEYKRTQDVFVYARTENEINLPPGSLKDGLATLAKHQIDKAQAA